MPLIFFFFLQMPFSLISLYWPLATLILFLHIDYCISAAAAIDCRFASCRCQLSAASAADAEASCHASQTALCIS
jgi:hypothetical protein